MRRTCHHNRSQGIVLPAQFPGRPLILPIEEVIHKDGFCEQGFRIVFDGGVIRVVETKPGTVLMMAEGVGRHLTMIAGGTRLTVHDTLQRTKKRRKQVNGTPLFAFNVARAERVASTPAFQQEGYARVRAMLKEMRSPQQLRSQGVDYLVPIAACADWIFDPTVPVMYLQDADSLWAFPMDTAYIASGRFGTVGLVIIEEDRRSNRIELARMSDIVDFLDWLIRQFVGPHDLPAPRLLESWSC